jgi:hypothetical protein
MTAATAADDDASSHRRARVRQTMSATTVTAAAVGNEVTGTASAGMTDDIASAATHATAKATVMQSVTAVLAMPPAMSTVHGPEPVVRATVVAAKMRPAHAGVAAAETPAESVAHDAHARGMGHHRHGRSRGEATAMKTTAMKTTAAHTTAAMEPTAGKSAAHSSATAASASLGGPGINDEQGTRGE